jgi:hypothetical protein
MHGKSVANQRLESWQGLLRKQGCTGGYHFSRILLISKFRYNKSCTYGMSYYGLDPSRTLHDKRNPKEY